LFQREATANRFEFWNGGNGTLVLC
jgi:hypothetical protein